jgi:hypothetical protein
MIIIYLNITIRLFYIIMTYKRETMTILAIAIMAAAMVSASVVIALTLLTEGLGNPQVNAKLLVKHDCKGTNQGPPCGHGKIPARKRA